MPSEVDVHAQIGEAFGLPDAGYELYTDRWLRNVHHYTDYQPYRGPMSNNAEPEQSARRNDTGRAAETTRQANSGPEGNSADQPALSMILRNTGESGRVLRQLSGSDSPRGDYAAKIEPHWGCHKDRAGPGQSFDPASRYLREEQTSTNTAWTTTGIVRTMWVWPGDSSPRVTH